jgi:anthranilate phosphoribosyltransferase
MAETLLNVGVERGWVVHGQGLDELTLGGVNHVAAFAGGKLERFEVTAAQVGLDPAPIEAIRGGDAAQNAAALLALLRGAPGPYRDTVLLNTAAALVIADRAGDLREGIRLARGGIDSGAALAALESLRREAPLQDSI